MELTPVAPERQLPDLSYMEVPELENLRAQQLELISQSNIEVLDGVSLSEVMRNHSEIEARLTAQAQERTRARYTQYLEDHLRRTDNPEVYDRLLGLLEEVAATDMDSEKWYLGDPAEDGGYIPGTSGRAKVRQVLAELHAMSPESAEPTQDPQETQQQYLEAMTRLSEARTKLAELSIVRRQRTFSDKEQDDYTAAQEAYEDLVLQVGGMKVAYWRDKGFTEVEFKAKAVETVLAEHQLFSEAELVALEQDDSRRGRAARWLAKKHRWAFASGGAGIALGFTARWALGLAGGLVIGATGGAAAGAGIAAKASRAYLNAKIGNTVHLYRNFDKKADEDKQALRSEAADLDMSDHDRMVEAANDMLQNLLDNRVDTDRSANRRRAVKSALIGGGAGVVGALIEPVAEHIGMPSLHDLTHHHSGGSHKVVDKPNTDTGGGVGDHGAPGAGNHQPGTGNTGDNPPAHHSAHPHHKGEVDGYQTRVHIAHGEGYQQAINDLAHQKGIHLTDKESWQLYEHLNSQFHGHFLSNDPSYKISSGNWGISRPGAAHWDPGVIHAMNSWMHDNGHEDKLTTVAKSTKKVAKTALKGSKIYAGGNR